MKGIYLTEEGKKAIEDEIAELEDYTFATQDLYLEGSIKGHLYCLKEILSSATILPIYESLGHAMQNKDLHNPNGVIIQPKTK
jgi:hypothetical protein